MARQPRSLVPPSVARARGGIDELAPTTSRPSCRRASRRRRTSRTTSDARTAGKRDGERGGIAALRLRRPRRRQVRGRRFSRRSAAARDDDKAKEQGVQLTGEHEDARSPASSRSSASASRRVLLERHLARRPAARRGARRPRCRAQVGARSRAVLVRDARRRDGLPPLLRQLPAEGLRARAVHVLLPLARGEPRSCSASSVVARAGARVSRWITIGARARVRPHVRGAILDAWCRRPPRRCCEPPSGGAFDDLRDRRRVCVGSSHDLMKADARTTGAQRAREAAALAARRGGERRVVRVLRVDVLLVRRHASGMSRRPRKATSRSRALLWRVVSRRHPLRHRPNGRLGTTRLRPPIAYGARAAGMAAPRPPPPTAPTAADHRARARRPPACFTRRASCTPAEASMKSCST